MARGELMHYEPELMNCNMNFGEFSRVFPLETTAELITGIFDHRDPPIPFS
jgi:hypothetical protein